MSKVLVGKILFRFDKWIDRACKEQEVKQAQKRRKHTYVNDFKMWYMGTSNSMRESRQNKRKILLRNGSARGARFQV